MAMITSSFSTSSSNTRKHNLLHVLRNRETSNIGKYRKKKTYYENVAPKHTEVNVDKPNCYFKKFTPDGRFLICFSACRQNIVLYRFNGPAPNNNNTASMETSNEEAKVSFSSFFTLHFETLICENEQFGLLCKDFCIISECGNYLILASSRKTPINTTTAPVPLESDSFTNQYSLDNIGQLEDIFFHVININTGKITNRRFFTNDLIYLSHNAGVYLYKQIFAILSVKNQQIHLFNLKYDGTLQPVKRFGLTNCFDDDAYCVEELEKTEAQYKQQKQIPTPSNDATTTSTTINKEPPKIISGLLQRILAFLFKNAQKKNETRRFYCQFTQLSSLVMLKMQFLDEHHLLIKFVLPDSISPLPFHDSHSRIAFFAIYNFISSEIVSVFDNASTEFAEQFHKFYEHFELGAQSNYPNNGFNNPQIRDWLQLHRSSTTRNSQQAHVMSKMTKCVLSTLPFSPQQCSSSPYFDASLFRYDEKSISPVERVRYATNYPIKFYSKSSGKLCFKIMAGHNSEETSRSIASYIFHPFYPFILSIQQSPSSSLVLNIHYHKYKC